jgi:hypothetical protein
MHTRFLVFLSAIILSSTVYSTENLPDDISQFIEQREGCDHFRGEYPYDEERRIFIEENLIELCTGIDASLAKLKEKYRANEVVLQKLSVYETDIELSQ